VLSDVDDLTRKFCVITGATSGLGLMSAQGLAPAGATVVLAGRDPGVFGLRLKPSQPHALTDHTPTVE
jgi:NAD(P)-dependent dehydrogenase (short-subunit alcohol dehydrogenase family)